MIHQFFCEEKSYGNPNRRLNASLDVKGFLVDNVGKLNDYRKENPFFDGDNEQRKLHQNKFGKGPNFEVKYIDEAFTTLTSHYVMIFLVIGSYISIIVLGGAMPIMAFTPEGYFDSNGWFNFISNGFEKWSVAATFIHGISTMFIFATRLFGVILYITSAKRAAFYLFVLVISQAAGILTVRNDQVKDIHLYAAGAWIASSLFFHLVISAWNTRYTQATNGAWGSRIVWFISTSSGIIFLFLVFFWSWDTDKTSRLVTGIFEFACAELILVNDFILTMGIHINFVMAPHPWRDDSSSYEVVGDETMDDSKEIEKGIPIVDNPRNNEIKKT